MCTVLLPPGVNLFAVNKYIISYTNDMGGACSTDGARRGVYRVLLGKPEGKKPLSRPKRRWEDNIKIDL
jgi:hypothetical protein